MIKLNEFELENIFGGNSKIGNAWNEAKEIYYSVKKGVKDFGYGAARPVKHLYKQLDNLCEGDSLEAYTAAGYLTSLAGCSIACFAFCDVIHRIVYKIEDFKIKIKFK